MRSRQSIPGPGLSGAHQTVDNAHSSFRTYKDRKASKAADKADSVVSGVKSGAEATDHGLRDGIGDLAGNVRPLVDVLQAVAKVHPFIEVAVNAFVIVVELNSKRRESDEKIDVLFSTMRDMMEPLQRLETVRDSTVTTRPAERAGSSTARATLTIRSRLEDLVLQTAQDIKRCANACDVYAKKRLLTKLIRSAAWDGTFAQYIELFARRRGEFLFRIAVHNGEMLDEAQQRLSGIDEKVEELLRVVKSPSRRLSREEVALREVVERAGGLDGVATDDAKLEAVVRAEPRAAMLSRGLSGASKVDEEVDAGVLAHLKAELVESMADALERNFEIFERKFKLQELNIVWEIRRTTRDEGDRIIEMVLDGPHRDIRNSEIRRIWVDSGWRVRVKSQDFALALYDHFRRSSGRVEGYTEKHPEATSTRMTPDERAALQSLPLGRMHSVIEAIDVDATGFVTVASVNRFSDSRPDGWSLLQWVLYWAIGWVSSMAVYRDKIETLVAKMSSLRRGIRTVDQEVLDMYLLSVHRKVESLTRSFRVGSPAISIPLAKQFQQYTDDVEAWLRKGLETVKYIIDARDTLTLIIGSGRMEEILFPLLFLLLSRDFQVLRLCQTRYISPEELIAAWHNLQIVVTAFQDRFEHLKDVFEYQNSDLTVSFRRSVCGMLEYWHDPVKLWALSNVEKDIFQECEYRDEEEGPTEPQVLNFPLATDHLYPCPEAGLTADDVKSEVKPIVGEWNGFFFQQQGRPCAAMYSFDFQAADPTSPVAFVARGRAPHRGSEFVVTGALNQDGEEAPGYSLWLRFVPSHYNTYNIYFTGRVDNDGAVFSGSWGTSQHDMPFTFEFRRIPAEVIVCRPSADTFRNNRAAALWSFALTTVHAQVLRGMRSTRVLAQRRRKKREWEAFVAGEPLDACELFRTTTFADACYYYATLLHRIRNVVHNCFCDHCGQVITGARVLCLECGVDNTIDVCDDAMCVEAVIAVDGLSDPHLPTHDVVKIRGPVQTREIGRVLKTSKAALARARSLLDTALSLETPSVPLMPHLHRHPGTGTGTHGGGLGAERVRSYGPSTRLRCIRCFKAIRYPCWFCSECQDPVFVCPTCDGSGGSRKGATFRSISWCAVCGESAQLAQPGTERAARRGLSTWRWGCLPLSVGSSRLNNGWTRG
ncbi:hypothetical protein C8Q74DRAFT_1330835 [Fomes fomentarius]|nr:hypothetical protein C8Q74DRAFT_1330835 [Fomes fomentarius]